MGVFSKEYQDAKYDEGYKARIEQGGAACPYEAYSVAAEAWWDGYDSATEYEGMRA